MRETVVITFDLQHINVEISHYNKSVICGYLYDIYIYISSKCPQGVKPMSYWCSVYHSDNSDVVIKNETYALLVHSLYNIQWFRQGSGEQYSLYHIQWSIYGNGEIILYHAGVECITFNSPDMVVERELCTMLVQSVSHSMVQIWYWRENSVPFQCKLYHIQWSRYCSGERIMYHAGVECITFNGPDMVVENEIMYHAGVECITFNGPDIVVERELCTMLVQSVSLSMVQIWQLRMNYVPCWCRVYHIQWQWRTKNVPYCCRLIMCVIVASVHY